LFALPRIFALKARGSATFRDFLRARNCVVQLRTADNEVARYYEFRNGKVTSGAGLHAAPDMTMRFKDVETALTLTKPPIDYAEMIHAGKNFRVILEGDEEVIAWFAQLAAKLTSDGWKMGEELADGTVRYMQMTNGGPLN